MPSASVAIGLEKREKKKRAGAREVERKKERKKEKKKQRKREKEKENNYKKRSWINRSEKEKVINWKRRNCLKKVGEVKGGTQHYILPFFYYKKKHDEYNACIYSASFYLSLVSYIRTTRYFSNFNSQFWPSMQMWNMNFVLDVQHNLLAWCFRLKFRLIPPCFQQIGKF